MEVVIPRLKKPNAVYVFQPQQTKFMQLSVLVTMSFEW